MEDWLSRRKPLLLNPAYQIPWSYVLSFIVWIEDGQQKLVSSILKIRQETRRKRLCLAAPVRLIRRRVLEALE